MKRTHVKFLCPREAHWAEEDDSVFGVNGASWFSDLLAKVPGLELDTEFLQEDWGIYIYVSREGKTFWVGLSPSWDAEHGWRAHVHHVPILQRFTRSGRAAMAALIAGIDGVLRDEPDVSNVRWMNEREG